MNGDLWDRLSAVTSVLRSAAMPRLTEKRFDEPSSTDSGMAGQPIVPNTHYFGLTLNELWLSKGREWWSTFDPLVHVAMTFDYGSEAVTLSKLIGPSALKGKLLPEASELPHGFVMRDIGVAPAHPFRGGPVDVTVVLYKVKRTDFAKKALALAEGLAAAFGGAAQIGPLLKLGGVVADTINALLQIGDSEPVLGHHVGLNPSPVRPLRMQSIALLSGEVAPDALRVTNDRLDGLPREAADSTDYVLYSLWGDTNAPDENRLPIAPLIEKMDECALAGDDVSWQRGKSLLMSLYVQLLASPDLFKADADRLFASFRQRMLDLRECRPSMMSAGSRTPTALEAQIRQTEDDVMRSVMSM
jgi:hypothetical protein